MKPCFTKRKLLALLAADALPEPSESALRRHLENCPGCREYARQLESLHTECAACLQPGPEVDVPAGLHQRIVARLREVDNQSGSSRFLSARPRTDERRESQIENELAANDAAWPLSHSSWKLAAIFVLLALAAGAAIFFNAHSPSDAHPSSVVRVVAQSSAAPLPAPSLINYHSAANQAGEEFERLLARQSVASARLNDAGSLSVGSAARADF
jgi:hypothetical protein